MKIGLRAFIGITIGIASIASHASDVRRADRPALMNSDGFVMHSGPTQGRTIITTPWKTIGPGGVSGATIGECNTLFWGYDTSQERVEGFSCTKK